MSKTRVLCDYDKLAEVFNSMAKGGVTISMVVARGYTKDQIGRHIRNNPSLVSAKVDGLRSRYFFVSEEAKNNFFAELAKPAPPVKNDTRAPNGLGRPIKLGKLPAPVTFDKNAEVVFPAHVTVSRHSSLSGGNYVPGKETPLREGATDFLRVKSRGTGHDSGSA